MMGNWRELFEHLTNVILLNLSIHVWYKETNGFRRFGRAWPNFNLRHSRCPAVLSAPLPHHPASPHASPACWSQRSSSAWHGPHQPAALPTRPGSVRCRHDPPPPPARALASAWMPLLPHSPSSDHPPLQQLPPEAKPACRSKLSRSGRRLHWPTAMVGRPARRHAEAADEIDAAYWPTRQLPGSWTSDTRNCSRQVPKSFVLRIFMSFLFEKSFRFFFTEVKNFDHYHMHH
nr:uncharacterized protein LOC117838164 isoform X1 [Setaria viridis]